MALRGLGSANSEDDGVLSSINVIPFVDIVLVLLIIFMLTSAVIIKASMKVDLPKAATAGATVATTINLTVQRDGTLLLNGAPTTKELASQTVKAEVARDPKTQAVISGDRGVEYGKVVEILDLVKLGGVTAFALDVERLPQN